MKAMSERKVGIMMRRNDRGAALVIAMVAIIAIAGMATALINMASLRSKGTNDRLDQFQAFQVAQAAVERARARMADPAIGPASAGFGEQFLSDARVGNLTDLPGATNNDAMGEVVELDGVEMFATVGDAGNGNYTIVGAARLGNVERVLEVVVKPPPPQNLPGPFPPSGDQSHGAVGVFGDASSVGFVLDSDRTEISGQDPHGKDCLGLAGSENAYAIIEDQVEAGTLDPSVFVGPVTNGYTLDDGSTATTSVGEVTNARVDGATMVAYADAIKSTAAAIIAANPDRVDKDIKPTSWGTLPTDVTILTHANAKTDGDVTGAGTLIVTGGFTVSNGDTFDWTGNVIVLGSGSKASIHNIGEATYTGIVAVIADDNKADFHANSSGNGTTINGAMLMMGGNATGGGGKVGFHINSTGADCDVNGMVMIMGDNVDFKVHGNVDMDVAGGLAFAVPDSTTSTVDIRLDANGTHAINIQQDSVNVDNALGEFEEFFDDLAPDVEPPPGSGSYEIVVWREK